MVKFISWNVGRRNEAWHSLLNTDADIALLQEATEPPREVADAVEIDPAPWKTAGAASNRYWRAAVVKLNQNIDVQWLHGKAIVDAAPGEFAISRSGTVAAAIIRPADGDPVVVLSIYAAWEKPHSITDSHWIYADASAHRLISDLSTFIGRQNGHQILVAGDLNILHGYGEHGSRYWSSRYASVFSRMAALGLPLVGPQAPGGRQAMPWPGELPEDSANVPTFYASHQSPSTASRQLDFVFASRSMHDSLQVRALNRPDNWGPSDHCRVEIIWEGD